MLLYLIPIEIRAPLNFSPLIFAHPQISRPFNFRAPLFYCKFVVFSFICGIFSSPFNFRAFALRELSSLKFRAFSFRASNFRALPDFTPFNFRAPLFYCKFAVFSFIRGIFSSPFNFRAFVLREWAPFFGEN